MKWTHRPFTLESAEGVIGDLPSMMKPQELDGLYSLAKHCYKGDGIIIDAGIFMGSSTKCFLAGAADSGRARANGPFVHSFERAMVTPAMQRFDAFSDKAIDQDYSDLIRKTFAKDQGVEFHFGDILDSEWTTDEKVEILFLDILKMPRVMAKCNRMFMPLITPGESIVVQQDYYWPYAWWINAWMEIWRDHFEIIDHAETSAVFRYVKQLPAEAWTKPLMENRRDNEMFEMLWNTKIPAFRTDQFVAQKLNAVHFLMMRKRFKRATDTMEQVIAEFFEPMFGDRDDEIALRLRNDLVRMQANIRIQSDRAEAAKAGA